MSLLIPYFKWINEGLHLLKFVTINKLSYSSSAISGGESIPNPLNI